MRLGRSNGPKRLGISTLHLRAETDPVSETFRSLEYWTMDKIQKPINPRAESTAYK
jgi:hypothetical protein